MTGAMTLGEHLRSATAPYAFLVRNSFLTALSFRWRTLLFFFTGAVQILVQYFLWQALYTHGPTFDGIGLQDMVSYLVLNSLLGAFSRMRAGLRLANSINDGSIAADLLKPLHLKLTYASAETGGLLADLCIRILPMFLVWAVFLRIKGPATPAALAAASSSLSRKKMSSAAPSDPAAASDPNRKRLRLDFSIIDFLFREFSSNRLPAAW